MKILFGVLVLTLAIPAMASEPCKFMLCMGAKDPMAIPECKPVIQNTLQNLKNGGHLPNCIMANGKDSRETPPSVRIVVTPT